MSQRVPRVQCFFSSVTTNPVKTAHSSMENLARVARHIRPNIWLFTKRTVTFRFPTIPPMVRFVSNSREKEREEKSLFHPFVRTSTPAARINPYRKLFLIVDSFLSLKERIFANYTVSRSKVRNET